MTAGDPSTSLDGGPEYLAALRAQTRALRAQIEASVRPQGPLYRASHRIDQSARPPLFLVHSLDLEPALSRAEQSGGGTLSVLVRDRQGRDRWQLDRIF